MTTDSWPKRTVYFLTLTLPSQDMVDKCMSKLENAYLTGPLTLCYLRSTRLSTPFFIQETLHQLREEGIDCKLSVVKEIDSKLDSVDGQKSEISQIMDKARNSK
jgi:hypothetical protein